MPRFSLCLAFAAVSVYADVSGLVLDAATGLPLAEVMVTVVVPGDFRSAKTGADGRFVFAGMQPGRYPVGAALAGYYPLRSHPFLGPFANAEPLVIRLSRAATIEGTVRAAEGGPVGQAEVHFFAGDSSERVFTGADGRYRFPSLPAGAAELEVTIPAGVRARLSVPARMVYPHPVTLRDGDRLGSIDFVLPRIRQVTVAGRVKDSATERDLADGEIALEPVAKDAWREKQERRPLEGGAFRFDGVQPGQYRLLVYRAKGFGSPPFIQALEVSAAGVANHEVVLPPPIRLKGRLTAPALEGLELRVSLMPKGASGAGANGAAGPGGTLVWEGLSPGKWLVMLLMQSVGRPPVGARFPDLRIASVTQDGRELGQEIEIVPGHNEPIEIRVVQQAALTGVVVDDAGLPLQGQWVWAVTDGAKVVTRAASDGTFHVGLPPGTYRVSAGPQPTEEMRSCEASVTVRVGDEGKVSVRLKPCP